MTPAQLRGLALELLPHLGIEPFSEDDLKAVGDLRERLDALAYPPEQAAPRATDARPIWQLVVEDMNARDAIGRRRYGVPLQAGNGRDALRDAYEEALDLVAYLRQALEERGDK